MNLHFNIFSGAKDAWEYRHEPEKMRVVAATYWRILFVIVVCAAAGAIFFGVEELSAVTQVLNYVPSSDAPQAPALDQNKLQQTLETFSARTLKYQAIASSSAPVADPSQ